VPSGETSDSTERQPTQKRTCRTAAPPTSKMRMSLQLFVTIRGSIKKLCDVDFTNTMSRSIKKETDHKE
jgi:hypothetical protein